MPEISFPLGLALDISFTILQLAGIGLTIVRLRSKIHLQRLWWDDYATGVAALIAVGYTPTLWLTYVPIESIVNSRVSLLAWNIFALQASFFIIWATRMAIALTIARIFFPGDSIRRFCIVLCGLCVVFWVSLSIMFSITCYSKMILGTDNRSAYCRWLPVYTIPTTFATLSCDTLIVASPAYSLWQFKSLPRKQRNLLLIGFAASSITLAVTVACSILLHAPETWDPARIDLLGKIGHFQSGISLMACNLQVIISLVRKVQRRRDQPTNASSSNGVTLTLTEVTIDFSASYFNTQNQWQSGGDIVQERGMTTPSQSSSVVISENVTR